MTYAFAFGAVGFDDASVGVLVTVSRRYRVDRQCWLHLGLAPATMEDLTELRVTVEWWQPDDEPQMSLPFERDVVEEMPADVWRNVWRTWCAEFERHDFVQHAAACKLLAETAPSPLLLTFLFDDGMPVERAVEAARLVAD